MKQIIDFVRSSIKWKLMFITIITILFVVSSISFFTFTETSRTIKNDVQRYSTQILKQANLNLNRYFVEYEQGFLSIGVSDEFQDWLRVGVNDKADMIEKYKKVEDKYIRPFLLRHPEILSVSVLNSNGNEMYYAGAFGFDMHYSLKNELDKFSEMDLDKAKICAVQTNYYRDGNGKAVQKRVITLTRGFVGWRDFKRGYIKVDISLEPTDKILGDIYLGKKSLILIADTDGNIVTDTDQKKKMEKLDEDLMNRIESEASGSFFRPGINDLVMYDTIPYTQWKTIAIVPYEDVADSIIHLRDATLWITLISLIIAILLTAVFASSITGRLVKLRKSIKQIQQGNLYGIVTIDGKDEVAELSRVYNNMLRNLKDTVHDLAESRVTQQKAVLSSLQSQINSHFLYNTLESINSMANLANQKDIERVTIALSNMLRYTSDYKTAVVRIQDEIRHMINYMEIIQIRYGGLVTYDLDVEEIYKQAECLKVIIQPLVENSVKHGIESTGKPLHISINVGTKDDDHIMIRIQDNGKGFPLNMLLQMQEKLASQDTESRDDKFSHVGLLNVQHRIRMFYKEESGIYIRNGEENPGAIVEIVCPVKYGKAGGEKE